MSARWEVLSYNRFGRPTNARQAAEQCMWIGSGNVVLLACRCIASELLAPDRHCGATVKVLCTGPLESDTRDADSVPAFLHPAVVGIVYTVRAMALMNNKVAVLLVGDNGWPTWFPLDRFILVDNEIPSLWEFTARTGYVSALWGYPTLIRDRDHFGDLHGRVKSASEIFLRESGVTGFDVRTSRFID